MKFAILYNTDYYPDIHGSAEQYYNQILEQVELEEELGFDAVWFGEHHYSGYSFGSPPVIAMAAAGRTKRIRLGTGISLVPLNNPIRLAEEYAMLDVLSGGRLEYGIGRGFLKYSHKIFGGERKHRPYHEGRILSVSLTSAQPFLYRGNFVTRRHRFFPSRCQRPSTHLAFGRLRREFSVGRSARLSSWRPPFSTHKRCPGVYRALPAGAPGGKRMSRQTAMSPGCFRCIVVNRTQKPGATAVSMR